MASLFKILFALAILYKNADSQILGADVKAYPLLPPGPSAPIIDVPPGINLGPPLPPPSALEKSSSLLSSSTGTDFPQTSVTGTGNTEESITGEASYRVTNGGASRNVGNFDSVKTYTMPRIVFNKHQSSSSMRNVFFPRPSQQFSFSMLNKQNTNLNPITSNPTSVAVPTSTDTGSSGNLLLGNIGSLTDNCTDGVGTGCGVPIQHTPSNKKTDINDKTITMPSMGSVDASVTASVGNEIAMSNIMHSTSPSGDTMMITADCVNGKGPGCGIPIKLEVPETTPVSNTFSDGGVTTANVIKSEISVDIGKNKVMGDPHVTTTEPTKSNVHGVLETGISSDTSAFLTAASSELLHTFSPSLGTRQRGRNTDIKGATFSFSSKLSGELKPSSYKIIQDTGFSPKDTKSERDIFSGTTFIDVNRSPSGSVASFQKPQLSKSPIEAHAVDVPGDIVKSGPGYIKATNVDSSHLETTTLGNQKTNYSVVSVVMTSDDNQTVGFQDESMPAIVETNSSAGSLVSLDLFNMNASESTNPNAKEVGITKEMQQTNNESISTSLKTQDDLKSAARKLTESDTVSKSTIDSNTVSSTTISVGEPTRTDTTLVQEQTSNFTHSKNVPDAKSMTIVGFENNQNVGIQENASTKVQSEKTQTTDDPILAVIKESKGFIGKISADGTCYCSPPPPSTTSKPEVLQAEAKIATMIDSNLLIAKIPQAKIPFGDSKIEIPNLIIEPVVLETLTTTPSPQGTTRSHFTLGSDELSSDSNIVVLASIPKKDGIRPSTISVTLDPNVGNVVITTSPAPGTSTAPPTKAKNEFSLKNEKSDATFSFKKLNNVIIETKFPVLSPTFSGNESGKTDDSKDISVDSSLNDSNITFNKAKDIEAQRVKGLLNVEVPIAEEVPKENVTFTISTTKDGTVLADATALVNVNISSKDDNITESGDKTNTSVSDGTQENTLSKSALADAEIIIDKSNDSRVQTTDVNKIIVNETTGRGSSIVTDVVASIGIENQTSEISLISSDILSDIKSQMHVNITPELLFKSNDTEGPAYGVASETHIKDAKVMPFVAHAVEDKTEGHIVRGTDIPAPSPLTTTTVSSKTPVIAPASPESKTEGHIVLATDIPAPPLLTTIVSSKTSVIAPASPESKSEGHIVRATDIPAPPSLTTTVSSKTPVIDRALSEIKPEGHIVRGTDIPAPPSLTTTVSIKTPMIDPALSESKPEGHIVRGTDISAPPSLTTIVSSKYPVIAPVSPDLTEDTLLSDKSQTVYSIPSPEDKMNTPISVDEIIMATSEIGSLKDSTSPDETVLVPAKDSLLGSGTVKKSDDTIHFWTPIPGQTVFDIGKLEPVVSVQKDTKSNIDMEITTQPVLSASSLTANAGSLSGGLFTADIDSTTSKETKPFVSIARPVLKDSYVALTETRGLSDSLSMRTGTVTGLTKLDTTHVGGKDVMIQLDEATATDGKVLGDEINQMDTGIPGSFISAISDKSLSGFAGTKVHTFFSLPNATGEKSATDVSSVGVQISPSAGVVKDVLFNIPVGPIDHAKQIEVDSLQDIIQKSPDMKTTSSVVATDGLSHGRIGKIAISPGEQLKTSDSVPQFTTSVSEVNRLSLTGGNLATDRKISMTEKDSSLGYVQKTFENNIPSIGTARPVVSGESMNNITNKVPENPVVSNGAHVDNSFIIDGAQAWVVGLISGNGAGKQNKSVDTPVSVRQQDTFVTLTPDIIPQTTTESIISTDAKPKGPNMKALCLLYLGAFIDGVGYAPYPGSCQKFVQCFYSGGVLKTLQRECPYGLFWDQTLLLCRLPSEVACFEDACLVLGTFHYPRSKGCRSFFNCVEGISVPSCCRKGFKYDQNAECVRVAPNEVCNDSCEVPDDFIKTMKGACPSMPDPVNKHGYLISEYGGLRIRRCPAGTIYSDNLCRCTSHFKADIGGLRARSKKCNPEFKMNFDTGYRDISDGGLAFEHRNVQIRNTTARFSGDGQIYIWGFTSRFLGKTFAISLRVKPKIGGGMDRPEPIISNCGRHGDASVEIYIYKGRMRFKAKTTNTDNVVIASTKYLEDEWNTVTYYYNGKIFGGSCGADTFSEKMKGNLESRDNPLSIGSCSDDGFHGDIDDVEIYTECVPHSL